MSAEQNGSDSSKLSSQQSPAPQQITSQSTPIIPHDLSFNINDILSSNHEVNVNDSSFQSIVQTLSNSTESNTQPSYAHLPAELRDLFSSSDTDALLNAQVNAADASILQGDMAALWGRPNTTMQQPQSSQIHSALFAAAPNQQLPTNFNVALPAAAIPTDNTNNNNNAVSSLLQTVQSKPLQRQSTTPTLQHQQSFQSQTHQISSSQQPLQHSPVLLSHQQQQQQNHIQLQLPPQAQRPQSPLQKSNFAAAKTVQLPSTTATVTSTTTTTTTTLLAPPQQQPQLPVLPPKPSSTQSTTSQQHTIQIVQPSSSSTAATTVFKAPALPGSSTELQVPTKSGASQTKIVAPSSTQPGSTSATAATSGTAAAATSGGGGSDRIDYDTLTDVMGYAGVDLREEAEHFVKEGLDTSLPDGIDRSKYQDFMNTDMLRERILSYAKCVNIKHVDNDFVAYIALATQDRLRQMMEMMVKASKHRTFDPFEEPPMISTNKPTMTTKGKKRHREEDDDYDDDEDDDYDHMEIEEEEEEEDQRKDSYPLYKIHVKQNVKQQLDALEKVDRQTTLDLDPMDDEEEEEDSYHQGSNRKEKDHETTRTRGWYSKKLKQSITKYNKHKQQQPGPRNITVKDAIFAMERDVQAGRGTNQRTLLKAYNDWLK